MSKIQWTDKVWNPVTGCTKVSAGCKNCYAERIADRKLPGGGFTDRAFTDVRCHPERLAVPLHWRKPRKVFVNSMSDLFHKDVPDEFIDRVFAVMALCPQHTFQVLTKRPDAMHRYMARPPGDLASGIRGWRDSINRASVEMFDCPVFPSQRHGMVPGPPWPLPNVWLGVSVEDQETADERIPLLLQTPAAVRFVSYEPALGPVDFRQINARDEEDPLALYFPLTGEQIGDGMNEPVNGPRLDWLIVGGESGPGARPCDVAWIRSAVEQCRFAGVPVFVKQFGARPRGFCSYALHDSLPPVWLDDDGVLPRVSGRPRHDLCHAQDDYWWPCDPKLKDRKGGNPDEWPADLRVREFPGGSR